MEAEALNQDFESFPDDAQPALNEGDIVVAPRKLDPSKLAPRPIQIDAQQYGEPKKLDPSKLAPRSSQPEKVFFENTRQVVELPSGGLNRIKTYVSGGYDRGLNGLDLNELYFQQVAWDDSPTTARKIQDLEKKVNIEFNDIGIYEDAFRAAVEMTPQLLGMAQNSIKRGAQGGAIGAATGFVAGNLTGVGVALPEELLTVPSGAIWGAKRGALIGAGEFSFRQNAGEAYGYISNMLDKEGVKLENKNLARLGAVIAGATNAGMDMIPIGYLSKAFVGKNLVLDQLKKTGAKSLVIPKGKEAAARFVLDYAKYIAAESVTEAAQEGVKLEVGEMAKYFSDQEFENLAVEEILSQMGSAAKEAAKATAVLGMAGGGVKGSYHLTKNAVTGKKEDTTEDGGITDQPQTEGEPLKITIPNIKDAESLNNEAEMLDELAVENEKLGDIETAKSQKEMATERRQQAAAIADPLQKESAARANEAIAPIQEQEKAAQQEKLANIQAETDDISLNLQREITTLQEDKTIVDPELHSLLEDTASLLSKRRNTPKPVTLVEFLKKLGGIKEDGGELQNMGMKNRHAARNDKSGLDFDMAREAAAEAGYMDKDSTVADFLVALESEYKGLGTIVREADVGIQSRLDEIDSTLAKIDEALDRSGMGTYSRERLGDLRRRVAENKKLDKATAREIKKRESELQKLESAKREAEKSPPKILADKMKTFIQGLRKGTYLGRYEALDVQNQLIDMIEASGLDANDRAKFIRTIKNTQTIEQLQNKLPEVIERIEGLTEAKARRDILSGIKSALSQTKAKSQNGKPVGKYGADMQVMLDTVREIISLSVEDAKTELNKAMSSDGVPSPNQALMNRALAIAARDPSLSVEDMQSFLDDIDSIIKMGKSERKNSLFARAAKINSIKMQAYEEITKGENIELIDEASLTRKIKRSGNNIAALQDAWLYGWYDMMDVVFGNSPLRNALRIGMQIKDEKTIARQQTEAIEKAAMDIFGFTKRKQWLKKLASDSRIGQGYGIDLGVVPNMSGQMERVQMTVAEARKLWMEAQDPSLQETLSSRGSGNQYTESTLQSIFAQLEPEDIAFAQSQIKLYQEFYNKINQVYRVVYGVDLPKNEFYSPIRRDVHSEIQHGKFLSEMQYRNSVASGSLKTRIANLRPLKKQSDIQVYQQHVAEMSHFIAFAEKVQEIQGVFKDGGVRRALEKKRGTLLPRIVDSYIEAIIRNGPKQSEIFGGLINTLNKNFALAVLGGKLAMIPKQMTSFVSSAADMPVGKWSAGIVDFASNPAAAIKILSQSEMLKARGYDGATDIAAFGKSLDWDFLKKKQTFDNLMMIPIKIGDRAAIYSGGWPVYKYAKEQGKTDAEAIAAFEEWFETTQQSGSIDQLSYLQLQNAFVRTATMFLSAPAAYLRAELRAIRHWKSGEISTFDLGRKLAIYHVVIPSFFQFVANAFDTGDDEKDDIITAAWLGPIEGYFIFGNVFAASIKGFPTASAPYTEAAKEFMRGVGSIMDNPTDMDEVADGIKDISKGAGMATGVPVGQIANTAEGIEDIGEGETWNGILRIAGWPKGAVEGY